MHLIKSSKLLLCSLLFVNSYALDSMDESILSDVRKKPFDLTQEQSKEEASKLKKDWINPITLQYTKNLGEEYKNEKSIISINQPIFKSGGIYEAIKYANSTYDYSTISTKQSKNELVKQAYNLLYSIEKSKLNINRAKLSVENAKIDVKRKKEQVLNGFLDSSYLDDALLTLNNSKTSLVELEAQKKELINSFHSISSQKYTKFKLPEFNIVTQKDFIKNNIELKKANIDIEKKDSFSKITVAKYLPSVNVFYNYSKNHFTDGKPGFTRDSDQNYGLSISVPLDSRTLNDIESKKIDYLKSKLDLTNKIEDEKTFYLNKINKIEKLDKKIEITKEDLKVYDSILSIIKEEKEAELKTQSDFDTLQNSQKIKLIDLDIFKIERQLELLELYAKLY